MAQREQRPREQQQQSDQTASGIASGTFSRINVGINVNYRQIRTALLPALLPALVAVGLCLLYLSYIFVRYDRDLREFVRPTPAGEAGYDGQFSYCIALDPNPVTLRPCLDVPAYRYQRILHPVLARVFGLANPTGILYALVGINLAALGVGVGVLAALLRDRRASVWFALVYGLFGGVFFAVRSSTTEPLAYCLVIVGFTLYERKNALAAAILLLLAVLTKETTILIPFALGLHALSHRNLHAATILLFGVALPYAAWQYALFNAFGAFGLSSGGAMATPFEVVPFMGILRIAAADVRLFVVLGGLLLLFAVLPTVYGLINAGRVLIRGRGKGSPITAVLFVSAAIMLFVPFSTYREPFGIMRFMPGLVFAFLLYAAEHRDQRALRFAPLWLIWGVMLWG